MLPSPADDPRSDTTALVVAVSGVIGPVPYVMAVAAIRMAGSPQASFSAGSIDTLLRSSGNEVPWQPKNIDRVNWVASSRAKASPHFGADGGRPPSA